MPEGRRRRDPATRAGRTGADKRRKGVADRNGAGEGAASSATTLVADEARRLIGKIQPVLIGCNAPLRLECPRPAAFLPNKHNPPYGLILPEALQSERTSAADAPPMHRRCADDAPRCLGLTRDQCVASCHPDPPGTARGHAVVRAGRDSPVMRASMAWSVALSIL